MSSDTLVIDHQLLHQLQHDPRYGYALDEDKPSLLSELGRWLSDHLDGMMQHVNLDSRAAYVVYVVLLLLFLWWIWRSKALHHFFVSQPTVGTMSDEAIEADIHAADFDAELARALAAADYTRASRLLYLQTLKHLSDGGRIDWQPQQTPAQYARELKPLPDADAAARSHEAFATLTHHFMCIRYGRQAADRPLFDTMTRLQHIAEKGGEP